MKKIACCFVVFSVLICVIVCLIVFAKPQTTKANSEFLRIHIRANSNSEVDQSVKYKVKEQIVELLTPYIAQSTSLNEAKKAVSKNLDKVCRVADQVLCQNGFSYTSRADIRVEEFPTRSYGNVTLEAGSYDALIVELGEGAGDNWWCVMFPPLCFVDAEGSGQNTIKYKSKIVELIKKYF